MAKEIGKILVEDMDSFISSYLDGSLDSFVAKDAHESDVFDMYCNLGKIFDIFCKKLQEQKNTR